MILNDPKNKENIKEILSQGIATEFWSILLQALDESIIHLQKEQDSDDMRDLPAEQYKVEAEILKAKRANLHKLKDLPTSIIAWLIQPDQSEPNFDPYFTAEELKKEIKQG